MISVCIPVYNGAEYIGDTLQSLTEQTYKDFEVIVSDNASTDGTDDVVRRFESKFPHFKYVRNERNLGYTANVARAFSKAGSDFVAIFHADDVYSSTILERETEVLERNPNISAVFSRAVRFGRNLARDSASPLPSGLKQLVEYDNEIRAYRGGLKEFGAALLIYGNFFVCPSFMTRRNDYTEIGGFNDSYPTSEDLHLWIRYLKAGKKLALLDEPLVQYRISESQGSAVLRRHKEQSISFSVLDDLLMDESVFDSVTVKVYKQRKAANLLHASINVFLTGDPDKALMMAKKSRHIYKMARLNRLTFIQHLPAIGIPLAAMCVRLRRRCKSTK